MIQRNSNQNVVCFGEVLWDMLPTGKMPGGAPMNVAIHLRNFGNTVSLISKVGTDDLGKELLEYLISKDMDIRYIQVGQTHLTGVVKVNLDNAQNVSYKIIAPVAWDYIGFDLDAQEIVAESAAFVFGSLAARSEQTFETLKAYLKVAKNKILDINLRYPNYDKPVLEFLLQNTDLLKINEEELVILSDYFLQSNDLENQVKELSQKYEIPIICVTLGANGAVLFQNNQFYDFGGFRVEVVDTIGSGDSFLAMLISHQLSQKSIQETLENACAVGALVAQTSGATPAITFEQIENLKMKHKVTSIQ
ncbi:MAG: carbohydrate kinase [Saprospiraceae bacterium]|nr:carbohydrate kinase [Saprospiraceae bacterium]MBP7643446.1 carbohydrate kinase [Saprospiraceae bacterium]